MSHGYNPAGNVSGGQWQAAYQQQGQAAQSAQPQSYAGQSQQQFGGAQYAGPQSYAGQPQGNPQQYAGQQYPPPQAGQQYGGAQYAQPQQYAGAQAAPASGQGAGGYAQGGQQYAQSGQGGAPQVASQQYAGAQYAQPQQYAAPQSAPASGQGAGGYVQGGQRSNSPGRSRVVGSSTRPRSRHPRSRCRRAPNWPKTPERTIGYASRAGRTLPSSTARSAFLGSRSSLCSLGSRRRTTCTTPRSNSALLLMSSCVQESRWVPRHCSSSCSSPSSWSSSSAQTCDAIASEARCGVIRASFLRPW